MWRGRMNTRGDSSYNDTADALIKASKESAMIDATGRDIGIQIFVVWRLYTSLDGIEGIN